MGNKFLQTYLNDHFAASSAGQRMAHRVASRQSGTAHVAELHDVAAAITQDRARLRQLMIQLDVPENRMKQLLARGAELGGRLMPNRYLIRRSPLSDLVELEALRVAVNAKKAGWQALAVSSIADHPMVANELADLMRRADEQSALLEDLHTRTAGAVLDEPPRPPVPPADGPFATETRDAFVTPR